MMDTDSLGLGLLGIGVGGGVTAIYAYLFYRKASKDLEEKTRRLQRVLNTIASGLERAGLGTFERDAAGDVIGTVTVTRSFSTHWNVEANEPNSGSDSA